MYKQTGLTKTQMKEAKQMARLDNDPAYTAMIDSLTRGHLKVMSFIDRGIAIQSSKIIR